VREAMPTYPAEGLPSPLCLHPRRIQVFPDSLPGRRLYGGVARPRARRSAAAVPSTPLNLAEVMAEHTLPVSRALCLNCSMDR
jgi:hypothetical protein